MRFGPLAAGLVAAVALAGCGIGPDDRARDIPPERQQDLTPPEPADPGETGEGALVYFLAEGAPGEVDRVVASRRDVTPSPSALVGALLAGPSATEQADGRRTALPLGTTLRSVGFVEPGTIRVDLSDDILAASADTLVDAIAQIVLTLTTLEGVDRVRIDVEGEPHSWPRGDGVIETGALTAYDFPNRAATTQSDYPPLPSS